MRLRHENGTVDADVFLCWRRNCGRTVRPVPQFRIRQAAELLGVSDDTVRRLIEAGTLDVGTDEAGRKVIDGAALAAYARANVAARAPDPSNIGRSARNRFVGLVSKVDIDGIMAQVEIQSGPHTVVSLMSSEAVRELNLEPGQIAVAVVKATMVIVEIPEGTS